MAKHLALKDIYLGQLVVKNEDAHSQVYTIGIIRKLRTPEVSNQVYLIWFEYQRKYGQWDDYSKCYLPSLLQIQRSICYGRLASSLDLNGVISERLANIKTKSKILWRDIISENEINGQWVVKTKKGTLVADPAPLNEDEGNTFTALNGKRYWDVPNYSQWTPK